ncbi:hypothetical protein JTB14_035672 [Gonioctena quinquepunctata]|nr:hypothetical protein JTB14_035672 [Gonioctena quinquepunctata]
MQNRAAKAADASIDEQIQKKKMLNGVSTDKQFQHSKLMDEFKQAHQKMFKSTNGIECSKQTASFGMETMERLAHKELSQKLSHKLLNLANSDMQERRSQMDDQKLPPPPPPPPPSKITATPTTPTPTAPQVSNIHSNTLKSTKTKPKAPPVPAKHSVLSFRQPPPCPTPDYDTLSLSSTSSTIKPTTRTIQESVEMDSLDSFQMNNPDLRIAGTSKHRENSSGAYEFTRFDCTPNTKINKRPSVSTNSQISEDNNRETNLNLFFVIDTNYTRQRENHRRKRKKKVIWTLKESNTFLKNDSTEIKSNTSTVSNM